MPSLAGPPVRYTVGAYVVSAIGVLLLWHPGLDAWVPAGGDIDLRTGEPPHAAALRQVRDEIGLEATIVGDVADCTVETGDAVRILPRPRSVQELVGDSGPRYVDFVYFCASAGGSPTLNYRQARAYRWFTQRDLDRFPLRPHVRHHAGKALKAHSAVDSSPADRRPHAG